MRTVSPQVDQIDGYVTAKRAAEVIGVVDSRVKQLVRSGELRSVAINNGVLVELASVEEYIARHAQGGPHAGRPRGHAKTVEGVETTKTTAGDSAREGENSEGEAIAGDDSASS